MTAVESAAAPDYVEPLEAWRVWRVARGKEGYRLRSVVKATPWPVRRPLVAECLRGPRLAEWLRRKRRVDTPVPDARCECGIYGARLAQATEYLPDPPTSGGVTHVLGKVSLWGRVIECERGFRASHAYPLRLYVPAVDEYAPELVDALDVYGVPVELLHGRPSETELAV